MLSQENVTPVPAASKILIVDDDDAIRNMVERVLRREKFEVESARDGFEAIEKLSRNDYGTILLDLMMPRWMAMVCCGSSSRSWRRRLRRA
jgi:DNA-binding response OmpR family regulator